MAQRTATPPGPTALPRRGWPWAALALANVALLFLGAAGVSAALMDRFVRVAEPGMARVVSSDHFRLRNGNAWDTGFAVVMPNGRTLTATWSYAQYFPVDTVVPVLYRTEPTVIIRPAEGLWDLTHTLLMMGGAVLMLATLFYARHRWRHARAVRAASRNAVVPIPPG